MTEQSLTRTTLASRAVDTLAKAALNRAARIPSSQQQVSAQPRDAARLLTRAAANQAAMTSGTLAMAPGPLGLLTLLPDLLVVWRIQAQLVSDIAAVYGQTASLSREHMLYCLFKHGAAQAMRDLVVRAGDRWLVRKASDALVQSIAKQVGLRLSRKILGTGSARFMPLLGALGVGGYAYYDTTQVAASAVALFERSAAS
jgi:EcsC protein family